VSVQGAAEGLISVASVWFLWLVRCRLSLASRLAVSLLPVDMAPGGSPLCYANFTALRLGLSSAR